MRAPLPDVTMRSLVEDLIQITAARRSFVGGRTVNEDYADGYESEAGSCWVVADGLGGHGGGEVASRLAVETILSGAHRGLPLQDDALRTAVAQAHAAIRAAQDDGGPPSMHTTVAVLATDGRHALWAHVGDTRLYHFREGRLLQQTADHSVPQMLAEAGDITREQIRKHEDRSRLLRALGQAQAPKPSVLAAPERLQPGDAFLLCTDGWWENVTEVEMQVDLFKSGDPGEWLDQMAGRIASRVRGDHDNYTAAAVFVDARC